MSLHLILSFSHESYGKATSLSNISKGFRGSYPPYRDPIPAEYYYDANGTAVKRVNAAFVVLARNSDQKGVMSSVKQMGMYLPPCLPSLCLSLAERGVGEL